MMRRKNHENLRRRIPDGPESEVGSVHARGIDASRTPKLSRAWMLDSDPDVTASGLDGIDAN